MKWYEIWQMNDDRAAGNPDYLGTVEARDEDEAETLGRWHFAIHPDQRLSVQISADEEASPTDKKLPQKKFRGAHKTAPAEHP